MNTAILIFVLFLFGLVLCFACLFIYERFKAHDRITRRKIIKLTNELKLLQNKVEIMERSDNKKQTTIQPTNVFDAMEKRVIAERKKVVLVNDEEVRVG